MGRDLAPDDAASGTALACSLRPLPALFSASVADKSLPWTLSSLQRTSLTDRLTESKLQSFFGLVSTLSVGTLLATTANRTVAQRRRSLSHC